MVMKGTTITIVIALTGMLLFSCRSSLLVNDNNLEKSLVVLLKYSPTAMNNACKACTNLHVSNIEATHFTTIAEDELNFPLFALKPVEIIPVGILKLTYRSSDRATVNQSIDALQLLTEVVGVRKE